MEEEIKVAGFHPADVNGDGVVSEAERRMYLEAKRRELEDQDARRDAMRQMTWFALLGMLLYPVSIGLFSLFSLDNAVSTLGSMAATYFVSVSAIVIGYFGANAYTDKKPAAPAGK